MKHPNKFLAALALTTAFGLNANAADVGVSVNISQPGFYGRIDIGRVPAPMVIYPRPVIIEQHPVTLQREPIYLRVPPGHEKRWDKYCRRYNACGQPVYFVQDNWYRDVYVPRYNMGGAGRDGEHGDHDNRGDRGRDKKHKKDRGHD
ncbi:MAG: hypothetical protein GW928_03850 [Rhodoferax sp.]|nr:hypothetical protein [Rhodoferax sp.]OIP14632.1 MAG: hypothetical protein AUK50_11655 [Comamonadaceae bacterium CG2_30_57_122]